MACTKSFRLLPGLLLISQQCAAPSLSEFAHEFPTLISSPSLTIIVRGTLFIGIKGLRRWPFLRSADLLLRLVF